MADDYDYDVDDGLMYDDDWLYVEDEFLLPDELAESQVADPGYAGTNYDIEMDSFDYDLYMYWDDQEYGYDEYWDYGGLGRRTGSEKVGQKRKTTPTKLSPPGKKRKISDMHRAVPGPNVNDYENVIFMSREEREKRTRSQVPVLEKEIKVAFLADWRARFADESGATTISMPADMRRAAEARENDEASHDVDNTPQDDSQDALTNGIDSGTLKVILQQRLEEAGLSGVDQGAFMATITQMLSGDGAADDAMGELAGVLLGKASDTGGGALSGWLSQQGVSLNDEQDDASSVATADVSDMPQDTLSRHGQLKQKSCPGSTDGLPGSGQTSAPIKATKGRLDVPSSAVSMEEKSESNPNEQIDEEETIEVKPRKVPGRGKSAKAGQNSSEPNATKSGVEKPSRKRKAASTGSEAADEIVVEPAAKRTRAARARGRN